MKEHQEEIRHEMKREQRTFRNIVDALHQSVVADPMRAESYLSDDIGQESSPTSAPRRPQHTWASP